MARSWRFFGPDTELTPLGRMVMAEDIAGLEASLGRDWRLDEPIHFCRHCDEPAISVAIIEGKQRLLDFLLAKGADLNAKGRPAISYATRSADIATIEKLLAAGARLDAENNVGSNAYSCALYSDRFDLLPFLAAKGLRVDADRGKSFRQAVFSQQRVAVEFFLAQGIDPNIRAPDMVHPNNPTAVQVAASRNDFEIVRLLVEHGADITLEDADGRRPFLEAAFNRNIDMQEYFRRLEPADWHDPIKKIAFLRECGLPDALIVFLQRQDRKIAVNAGGCSWIELSVLLNVHEMRWRGRAYIALMSDKDDRCACGLLVWSKAKRRLAIIDQEHDEIVLLSSWDKFIADPDKYLAMQW